MEPELTKKEEEAILQEIVRAVKKRLPALPSAEIRDYALIDEGSRFSRPRREEGKPSAYFWFNVDNKCRGDSGDVMEAMSVTARIDDAAVIVEAFGRGNIDRRSIELSNPSAIEMVEDRVIYLLKHLSKIVKTAINNDIRRNQRDAGHLQESMRKFKGTMLYIDQVIASEIKEKD